MTLSKQERRECLKALNPACFARYEDYYFAIHLTPGVRRLHVLGMLLGFGCLYLSFRLRMPLLLVAYLPLFIGIPQLSHWLCDGIWSPAIRQTNGSSLFMALELNFSTLLGLHAGRQRKLLAKYPFVREIYGIVEPLGVQAKPPATPQKSPALSRSAH